jgi:hypothetical protein
MHARTHTFFLTLFVMALVGGCRDLTTPSLAPRAPLTFEKSGEHQAAVAMPCNVSVQSMRGTAWTARRTTVTFPVPTLSPENRTTVFFVRGYNDRREITAVAACVIPATPAAVEWIGRAFRISTVKRGFNSPADGVTIMSGEPAFALEPLVATACSPGYTGEHPDCEPIGDGETSPDGGGSTTWGSGTPGGGGSGSGTSTGSTGSETGTESAPDGYDTDPPPPEEEDESRNCPAVLSGKVITAGIEVAGIMHTFKFDGPMTRISGPRSPARYEISHPTVSEDSWWIAEAGWIEVNCNGVYSPNAFGFRLWIGTASYAGESDLHMVRGPNHPTSY